MTNLREIIVNFDALILIERILASCIDMDKSIEEIRFSKALPVTLQDLFDRFPVPAVGLANLCSERKCKEVGSREIIDLFAGPTHAQAIKERLENPHQVIVVTGQLFLERMKEVNIHFEKPDSKAAFGLLDLATTCKVTSRSGRKVNVKILNKAIRNCVLPPRLMVEQNSWVLCHMGAVITSISPASELTRIQGLQKNFKDAFFLKKLLEESEDVIDCKNFCPSRPNKKDGCNLTAWNLDRL